MAITNNVNAVTSVTPFEEAVPLLNSLKDEYTKEPCDLAYCKAILQKLKLLIHFFPSSPPTAAPHTNNEEIIVAVEALELGAFISVRSKDASAFERYFAQLSTFYQDFREALPQTEKQYLIIGMNLLHLLSKNDIGEFHMTLQLFSNEEQKNKYIKYAIDLDKDLSAGNYKKILLSTNEVPDPMFGFFMNSLVFTVRLKMAKCLEKSYESINAQVAATMLRLDSLESLAFFATTENKRKEKEGENDVRWLIQGDLLIFSTVTDHKQDIAAMELIENCIGYATELELIV